MEQIIIALITVLVPSTTTLITNHSNKKREKMHNAKQSILQLILEDKVRVMEGRLPENYQMIHHEFDEYQKDGGNSYIHNKVDAYDVWYQSINEKGN